MLVKVALIPPNKDYIVLRTQHGQVSQFPRQFARHVSTNDICLMAEYRGRPQLKLLTDDDEVVIMNAMSRSGPLPKPPEPIPTP
jgi:hypothetical protein